MGADIDAPGKMGKTALRRAIGRSDVPMVAHLLRRGADMRKVTTNKGWNSIRSAFRLEVLTRKPEDRLGYPISELLILHGAKLEEFRVCMTERSKEEDFRFYTDFYTRLRNARESIVTLLGVRFRSPLLKLIGKDIALHSPKTSTKLDGIQLGIRLFPKCQIKLGAFGTAFRLLLCEMFDFQR